MLGFRYLNSFWHFGLEVGTEGIIFFLMLRRCQNYRTKLGVQKYGKIPYLRTPPDPDSARIWILFYN